MTTKQIIEYAQTLLDERHTEIAHIHGKDWTEETRNEVELLDLVNKRIRNIKKSKLFLTKNH